MLPQHYDVWHWVHSRRICGWLLTNSLQDTFLLLCIMYAFDIYQHGRRTIRRAIFAAIISNLRTSMLLEYLIFTICYEHVRAQTRYHYGTAPLDRRRPRRLGYTVLGPAARLFYPNPLPKNSGVDHGRWRASAHSERGNGNCRCVANAKLSARYVLPPPRRFAPPYRVNFCLPIILEDALGHARLLRTTPAYYNW